MGAPQAQTQHIVLGAGYCYFDIEDSGGDLTGERYLGDSPDLTLNITTEKLEVDNADTPVAEKLISTVTKVDRKQNLTLRDFSVENWALFVMGSSATVTQTNTPVIDEPINGVLQGRYYQLGASVSNPTGARDVSAETITDDVPNAAFVAVTDYVLDADLGRLYIVPGGGIADGTNLLNDYTTAANTRDQVTSHGLGAANGAFRFTADNTQGSNRDLYLPRVEMAPTGDASLKSRTDLVSLGFELSILTRTGYQQAYLDGRPV